MEKNFRKEKMIIDKYNKRAKKINSLLCVGLDADFAKIPKRFLSRKFPQFEFNKWIIGETHQFSSAYKLNMSIYEDRGEEGLSEMKMTTSYLQKNYPDIFTICDAKRGDIGPYNKGYVNSTFDIMGFDAMTLHPYLGKESLEPFLDRKDKGCIIICRTSNPGAGELQDLIVDSVPLWQKVAQKVVNEWNKNKNCMLVVGATYPKEMKKIRRLVGDMTFLVPGIGAQGGDLKSVLKAGLNKKGLGLIINSSRSIIFSKNPKKEARKLYEEIRKYNFS
ncbi:MAG: orotidine-5'-phosphate decarboxylase [Parcubacteria group bacterium Gr01-1014_24]|nr:MAG: orotidine-5'-phosphate decarboxylase [Parcubacteria group bacterium Gr01-1014_24]